MLSLVTLALSANHEDLSSQFGPAQPQRTWEESYALAKTLIGKLNSIEKIRLTTGVGFGLGKCAGNIGKIDKVDFPGMCLQDGPVGVRKTQNATVYPAGVTTAATFDRELMYMRSRAMGLEYRTKGINVALAPAIGALGRSPNAGRNWEGFGPDPYLCGIGGAESVRGLQDEGVIATAKHWVANEQERYRLVIENIIGFNSGPILYSISSNVPPRALRELYEWPFIDIIEAGAASVMCAYQRVNGTYSCESEEIIKGHLKSDKNGNLGFKGFVVTDWFAASLASKASTAGTDVVMPGDIGLMGAAAGTQAASDGALTGEKGATRLDEAALRVVAAWYKTGQDKGFPSLDLERDATTEFHAQIAQRINTDGTVLLKNTNKALPLTKKIKKIGVFGSDAGPIPKGPNSCGEFHTCRDGTLAVGWGSGGGTFEYLIDPLQAIEERAAAEGATVESVLNDFDYKKIREVAADKDVCLAFIQSRSGEGLAAVDGNVGDRNNLTAWHGGDALIATLTPICDNIVVVAHTVGPIVVEPWIEHPNVKAVLFPHLPGQESGSSLVQTLWGDVNPSGKLPYTLGKKQDDYCCKLISDWAGFAPEQDFTEGTNIDYRWFAAKGITPRFEFGFGLSYTTFAYDASTLSISTPKVLPDVGLEDVLFSVEIEIENTGDVEGKEAAQLYITYPSEAKDSGRWLRGFDKVKLAPGEKKKAIFEVRKRDVSYWKEGSGWAQVTGKDYEIQVGASERDVKAKGSVRFA
ncbi:putative beta-glucosidase L [Ascobolus immersus RN42]|uniref:Probable beta-glucosidase G n=1 Tax=Ascobolus immersus RN42 TaxID=1160509 RepID=A0A3N4IQ33_ASCIM|nr:putative beta-glucosidase L [Ascobolus immersus RN42]